MPTGFSVGGAFDRARPGEGNKSSDVEFTQ